MGFAAKDGKQFGNRQQMSAYNDREPSKKSAPSAEANDDEGTGDQNLSPQDIHEFVSQHGPAENMEIMHDHIEGKHKVHSHHGGYSHRSEHATVDAAHKHARAAAGGSEENDKESPEPMGAMAGGSSEIPGM